MANWAFTSYTIEGPKETLDKIHEAILHHDVREDSSKDWEGNILIALGCTWEEPQPNGSGKYMRGFIHPDSVSYDGSSLIQFDSEEAWGVTDFSEVLVEHFPDIKVFWCTEEPNENIYATNDKEGKYYPYKYWVDTCIDGNYQSDYFTKEEDIYKWLSNITDGKIKNLKDVAEFEDLHEGEDDDYISINEFDIV